MNTKKEDSLRRLNYSVLFVIGAIIVALTFVKFANVGYSIYSPSSQSSTASESLMFMKYLNHTSWDGVAYPLIKGINNESFNVGSSVYSSPAISGGYLYIGGWKLNATNVSKEVANSSGSFYSSPVISNGFVYIGNSSGFYKLNTTDLSIVANDSAAVVVESSAAVANGFVYVGGVGSSYGYLYKLNATDLSVNNSLNISNIRVVASPAIAKGYVYIGSSNGTFYQVNATDLTLAHSFTAGTPAAFNSSAAVSGNDVYVGSADGYLYQLNASDVSQVLHSFNTGSAIGYSSPAVVGNYVYIGSGSKVYQLNASNVTQKIGSYATSGSVQSSPSVANGYVYITAGNTLYQLNATNFTKKVASYSLGSASYSSPAVANGKVYIGTSDGYVRELKASNVSMTVNDLVAPQVKILIPSAGTDTQSIDEIEFNATDSHLAYCWYKINSSNSTLYTSCYQDITSLPTFSTAGTYTWTVWANDTSGNYNHTSRSFTISSASSNPTVTVNNNAASSSTSSTTTSSTTTPTSAAKPYTESFTSLKKNKPTSMNVSNTTGVGLTQVVITPRKDVSNASVTVSETSTSLSSIGKTSSEGLIYQSFKVNTSGVNDTSLSGVSFGFKVSASWFSSHNLDPSSVDLYRLPDGSNSWIEINATLASSDSNYYYYTAESPGFSTYAVFAGKPLCSVGQIRCLGKVVQICAATNSWKDNITCPDSCVQGECVSSKSSNFTLNGILGGIAPSFINTVWGYVVYYVLLMTVIAGLAFLVYLGVKKGTFGELFVKAKRLLKRKKNPEVGMVQEFFS